MNAADYEAFTAALRARLEADERILGLIATGSMAAQGILPDAYSDHDFWLVATPEAAEAWRTELSWLPRAAEILFAYRETAHGVKVVYRDGHLVEFAVFAPAELALARVNRYRLLIDRGGLAARLEELRRLTGEAAASVDEGRLAGEFLTNLLVAAGRYRRGEVLSAHRFVAGSALLHLLTLLSRRARSQRPDLRDDLDPTRRFELTHPRLATRLASCLRQSPLEAARELLEIYREELGPGFAGLPPALSDQVAELLAAGD